MREDLPPPYVPQDRHWPVRPHVGIMWTILVVMIAGIFSGSAIASGDLAVKILVPVLMLSAGGVLCVRVWRGGADLVTTTATTDTLVIRRIWLPVLRIPLARIMTVKASEYGPRMQLIDGRRVDIFALAPGMRFRKSWGPMNEVVQEISLAAQAIHEASPAETAAAIAVAAPQRARRALQGAMLASVLGVALLTGSFVLPKNHHDLRFAVIGIVWTLLAAGRWYALLRKPGSKL